MKYRTDPYAAQRNPMNGRVPGDEGLLVTFYEGTDFSEVEGRHIQKDFIKILVKGDPLFRIETEIDDDYEKRFWPEYKAFKDNQEKGVAGIPLTSSGLVNESTALNLAVKHIRTVEDLASLDDGVAMGIPHGIELRAKAHAFLHASENAEKAKQVDELLARIAALEAAQTKAEPKTK